MVFGSDVSHHPGWNPIRHDPIRQIGNDYRPDSDQGGLPDANCDPLGWPLRNRRPAPDDDVSRHDGSAADTDPVSDDGAVSDTGGAENHVLSEGDTRI